MNKKKNLLIFILAAVIIAFIVYVIFEINRAGYFTSGSISAQTDSNEYVLGAVPRITIKNNYSRSVCFSSCYPYMIEYEEGGKWGALAVEPCPMNAVAESCINPGESKSFEFAVPQEMPGKSRLSISVCKNCQNGQEFKEDLKAHSNEFTIK